MALIFALITMLNAFGQELDTTFPIYAWMKLRDSTNPVGLKEIKIESKSSEADQAYHDHSQFTHVDEYLERTPGLAMIGRGSFGKEPVLNGMNTDRVQVTIDGMPIMHACIGKMDPATSYVETNNLKKVEIENGGDGLAMTSNVGGNINFKTLDPKLRCCGGLYGNAGVEYQTNGHGRHAFLKMGTGNEKWGVLVNGSYRSSDPYKAGDGDVIPFSQFNKANVALAGKWKINDRQIFDADVIIDEAWNVGYPALPMDVPKASAQIFSLEWKNYRVTERMNWLKLKLFGNRVHHVMDNFSRSDYTMLMTMPGTTHVVGARAQSKIETDHHVAWDLDFDVEHKDFVASMTMFPENEKEMYMLTWPDISEESSAFSFSREYEKEKFRWIIGGRLEESLTSLTSTMGINQWEGLGEDVSEPEWRMSGGASSKVAYSFHPKLILYTKGAYILRKPTVSEQFGLYLYNAQDGFAYLGDPEITNEKSAQLTIGFQKNGKGFSAQGEGFYYHFNDYILGVIDEEMQPLSKMHNGVKRFTNLSRARMAGWNAEVSAMPMKGWMLYLSGEYVNAKDVDGNFLPLIPPFTITGGTKYHFKKGYVSMECISAAAQNKVSVYNGEDATEGYVIFNASAAYSFQFGEQKIDFVLAAENLTNAYYWHHLDWNNVPQPGRNISTSLTWQF